MDVIPFYSSTLMEFGSLALKSFAVLDKMPISLNLKYFSFGNSKKKSALLFSLYCGHSLLSSVDPSFSSVGKRTVYT